MFDIYIWGRKWPLNPKETEMAKPTAPTAPQDDSKPEPKEAKPRMLMRAELKAMHKIDEILAGLDRDARVRVLAWLGQAFPTTSPIDMDSFESGTN